jgi:hypothetical protein
MPVREHALLLWGQTRPPGRERAMERRLLMVVVLRGAISAHDHDGAVRVVGDAVGG